MTFRVGGEDVANFANTHPGTASGVVANANNGYGDAVGDGTVIVQGDGAATAYYILMENSGYVLQESGDKIQLET